MKQLSMIFHSKTLSMTVVRCLIFNLIYLKISKIYQIKPNRVDKSNSFFVCKI